MKRALIIGISGQDGAYLAQFLLSMGYKVFGSSRDIVKTEFHNLEKLDIFSQINLVNLITSDASSIEHAFSICMPDEVYNLSGQSSVGLSFDRPTETWQSIVDATANILEELRLRHPRARFFNAGSGECFGETNGIPANEDTSFDPKSPYAESKVEAFRLAKQCRELHKLFVCTGILFNHESPLRPTRFVTQKIIRAAVGIAQGQGGKLILGNLAIKRDWGWAPEYVDAMWRMLQQENPEDFVIATGVGHSLEQFVEIVFSELGLHWREHVLIDKALFRPNEGLDVLADPNKAKLLLNWSAKITLRDVISQMVYEAQIV
jgi:GDPmannose 4,6-dehydratase